ncbi:hypothetical protein BZA77DRAFT_377868 [Pyronema omphalodes]|nr:hypothetical protein BZA77DRAFT_377868 [Pyronema omphalodes]
MVTFTFTTLLLTGLLASTTAHVTHPSIRSDSEISSALAHLSSEHSFMTPFASSTSFMAQSGWLPMPRRPASSDEVSGAARPDIDDWYRCTIDLKSSPTIKESERAARMLLTTKKGSRCTSVTKNIQWCTRLSFSGKSNTSICVIFSAFLGDSLDAFSLLIKSLLTPPSPLVIAQIGNYVDCYIAAERFLQLARLCSNGKQTDGMVYMVNEKATLVNCFAIPGEEIPVAKTSVEVEGLDAAGIL